MNGAMPMYFDYYLERKMVKNDDVKYEDYNQEMAINVALCYFPIALLLFGIAVLLHNYITRIIYYTKQNLYNQNLLHELT